MTVLDYNISAYNRLKDEMESHHKGKWVLFHDGSFINAFDDFDNAAKEAVSRFGRGPYLIRQVGADDFITPASVMYRFEN